MKRIACMSLALIGLACGGCSSSDASKTIVSSNSPCVRGECSAIRGAVRLCVGSGTHDCKPIRVTSVTARNNRNQLVSASFGGRGRYFLTTYATGVYRLTVRYEDHVMTRTVHVTRGVAKRVDFVVRQP